MVVARVLTIAILAAAGASAQADDVMRCGSKIIEIGMTQAEVMQHCGGPTSLDVTPQAVHDGNRVVAIEDQPWSGRPARPPSETVIATITVSMKRDVNAGGTVAITTRRKTIPAAR